MATGDLAFWLYPAWEDEGKNNLLDPFSGEPFWMREPAEAEVEPESEPEPPEPEPVSLPLPMAPPTRKKIDKNLIIVFKVITHSPVVPADLMVHVDNHRDMIHFKWKDMELGYGMVSIPYYEAIDICISRGLRGPLGA